MQTSFIRFGKRLLLFSLVVYGFYFIAHYSYPHIFDVAYGELLLFYFLIITALGYYVLDRAVNKNPKEFVLYYMATLTVKFLAALTIIIVYFKLYKKLTPGFSITLLTDFFLYTIFELVFYLKWFKK